jgi:hypothetical protein
VANHLKPTANKVSWVGERNSYGTCKTSEEKIFDLGIFGLIIDLKESPQNIK